MKYYNFSFVLFNRGNISAFKIKQRIPAVKYRYYEVNYFVIVNELLDIIVR